MEEVINRKGITDGVRRNAVWNITLFSQIIQYVPG